MPQIHKDWLNHKEQETRDKNHISEEVNRRLRMEHNTSTEDQISAEHTWNQSDTPTTHEDHVPDPAELSNSESESDSESFTTNFEEKISEAVEESSRLQGYVCFVWTGI